ncbi:MAG: hypothetical protein RLZZ606_236 [Actinomycetota bacterium]|jgi:uncharacterized repeat protein (TIGR01451 family)
MFSFLKTHKSVKSLVVALVATLGFGALPALAVSNPIQITQTISYLGTEYSTDLEALELPSGLAEATIIVNYTCASGAALTCDNGKIDVPVPSQFVIGSINYPSADIASKTVTSNVITFNFNNLNQAQSAQITIEFSIPNWIIADGTAASFASTVSTDSGAANSATSNTLDVVIRAGAITSVTAQKQNGGAIDSTTLYSVNSCNDPKSPVSDFGRLAIQAGHSFVVTLPTGAVFESAGVGGVYDDATRTVTWANQTSEASIYCVGHTVLVSYPTSDPNNFKDASKTISGVWTGKLVGESVDRELATGSYTHSLTEPQPATGFVKTVSTPRLKAAAVDDPVTYFLQYTNSGTTTLPSALIKDTLPDGFKPNSISVKNDGRSGSADLKIKSKFGADGLSGTADDNDIYIIATLTPGTTRNINLYSTVHSTGSTFAAGDLLTYIEYEVFEIYPGDTSYALNVSGVVAATYADGSLVRVGDEIANEASFFAGDPVRSDLDKVSSATFTIDAPKSTLYPNMGTQIPYFNTNLQPGVRNVDLNLSGISTDFPLANPRYVLVLPKFVSMTAWSVPLAQQSIMSNSALPTMTQTVNFDGQGRTKIVFSWPAGTVQAKSVNWNNTYIINYSVNLGVGSFDTMVMKGYLSSATADSSLGPYKSDPAGFDTLDLDNDDVTNETLGYAEIGLTLATEASASLKAEVKGSWDNVFASAPGTGYTTPGYDDLYRGVITNTGTVKLKNVIAIEVLPRPGDMAILSASTRNPSSKTFPVLLRGKPIVPMNLANPVDIYYTTEIIPCLDEFAYAASGCTPANWINWDTTAPSSVADVTALKFDFGGTLMAPGDTFEIDIPVTTPETGASEIESGQVNPTTNSADDETAVNTWGYRVVREDLNSLLGAAESIAVTLQMPSVFGPPQAPTAQDFNTSGRKGAVQTQNLGLPSGGSISLVDGGNLVNSISVANVGVYVLDPLTGIVEFTPDAGFVGTAPAIAYRIENYFNLTDDGEYVASVAAPTAGSPLTSSEVKGQTHTVATQIPAGSTLKLLDNTGAEVDTLIVAGEGTYSLDSKSGEIVFTPLSGFGPAVATPVAYRFISAEGVATDATYTATVTALISLTPTPLTSTGSQRANQSATVSVPAGGSAKLLESGVEVTTLTIAGQGTYTIDPATGVITFVPVANFVGNATAVSFRVTASNGATGDSTYTLEVTPLMSLSVAPKTTSGSKGKKQTATVSLAAGASVKLLKNGVAVNSISIPGQGTYAINSQSGVITFTPLAGFVGKASSVTFRITASNGATGQASYTATVKGTSVVLPSFKSRVLFTGDSAALSGAALATLKSLAAKINKVKSKAVLTINGRVFETADTSYDRKLSMSRASSVAVALKRFGVTGVFKLIASGIAPERTNPVARRADIQVNFKN